MIKPKIPCKHLFILIYIMLFLSCNNPANWYSFKLTTGLYVEKNCIHSSGAGPFDTGTDFECYITDSNSHRKYIGTYDFESEFFHYKIIKNKLIVRRICDCRDFSDLSIIKNQYKIRDSTVYDLDAIGIKITPVNQLNELRKKSVIKDLLLNMKLVKGASFNMGGDWSLDQSPIHKVLLSDFYLGKFEVTQEQWLAIMGDNPSCFRNCSKCPVENITWDEVQIFITKLNTISKKVFRLPTEAEWEFAARGGIKSKGFKYPSSNTADSVGWYDDNSKKTTHFVGLKKPNELGLYDMCGNVSEMCSDWYDDDYKKIVDSTYNPKGVKNGQEKVIRGGSWNSSIYQTRSNDRERVQQKWGDSPCIGFRLALSN